MLESLFLQWLSCETTSDELGHLIAGLKKNGWTLNKHYMGIQYAFRLEKGGKSLVLISRGRDGFKVFFSSRRGGLSSSLFYTRNQSYPLDWYSTDYLIYEAENHYRTTDWLASGFEMLEAGGLQP